MPAKSFQIKKADTGFLLFLVVYALFITYLSYVVNIWEDEAYTLNTTSLNLKDVIRESYHFEGQPPFYFLLLAVWRLIYPGIFFARLLSIIFIGLAGVFFYKIVRLAVSLRYSRWLLVIFLINPFAVWASIEIRVYALLVLLSTLTIYSFLQYYYYNSRKYIFVFLISCIIGLYVQYFFILLLFVFSILLILNKGWKTFFIFCLYMIPVALVFIPNLYVLSHNVSNVQSQNPDYSLIQRVSVVINSFQNLMMGIHIFINESALRWIIRLIFLFLVAFSYFSVYKKDVETKTGKFKKNIAVIISLLVLVVLFVAIVLGSGIQFNDRYLAIAYPFVIMIFLCFENYSVRMQNIIFGCITLYFIVLLTVKYVIPIKTYDYQSVAEFIAGIENPNETILLNSKTISTPFQYYYHGSNLIQPLPDSIKYSKESFQVLIKDTVELKQIINGINSPSESILFINDNMIGYNVNIKLTTKMIDTCLKTHYKIPLDTLFYGRSKDQYLRIRRLVK